MKQHFMMFAAYNQWANGRIYEAAADLDEEEFNRDIGAFFKLDDGHAQPSAGRRPHLDEALHRRGRCAGDARRHPVHATSPSLQAAREAEDQRIIDWVGALSEKALPGRFTYMTVTDMRTVSQRLAPALAHFFNHQTHHRGQAHMILTVLGRPSVPLDLIYFQRTEEGRAFA